MFVVTYKMKFEDTYLVTDCSFPTAKQAKSKIAKLLKTGAYDISVKAVTK